MSHFFIFERRSICFPHCVTTIIKLICHSVYCLDSPFIFLKAPLKPTAFSSNLALITFWTCPQLVKLGFLFTEFLDQFSWFEHPVFFCHSKTGICSAPMYLPSPYSVKFKSNQKFTLHQKNLQPRTWAHI